MLAYWTLRRVLMPLSLIELSFLSETHVINLERLIFPKAIFFFSLAIIFNFCKLIATVFFTIPCIHSHMLGAKHILTVEGSRVAKLSENMLWRSIARSMMWNPHTVHFFVFSFLYVKNLVRWPWILWKHQYIQNLSSEYWTLSESIKSECFFSKNFSKECNENYSKD